MSSSLSTRDKFLEEVARERQDLAAYLPPQLPITRFEGLADLAVRANPDILKCTTRSVIECLYLCARHSLEPGIEAYLVPFGSTCSFVLSYRGTVTLLTRIPTVQRCFSEVLYRADTFDLDYGRVQQPLIHKPATSQRGDPLGAYGCVVLKDGGVQCHYMALDDITRVRHLSRLSEKGPWREHETEMMRKVALKVTAKQFPLLPAIRDAFAAEEMPPLVVSPEQSQRNVQELFGEPQPQEAG